MEKFESMKTTAISSSVEIFKEKRHKQRNIITIENVALQLVTYKLLHFIVFVVSFSISNIKSPFINENSLLFFPIFGIHCIISLMMIILMECSILFLFLFLFFFFIYFSCFWCVKWLWRYSFFFQQNLQ